MNHLRPSQLNRFSSATIDRMARTIGNVDQLDALANSDQARFLPVYNTKILVVNKAGRLAAAAIERAELPSQRAYALRAVRTAASAAVDATASGYVSLLHRSLGGSST